MIRETEVDGVRTLLSPKSGPLAAGLTFRVGRADETLATGGITHLLEHLALHHRGLSDYHYNGATGSVVTHFHLQGSADDVVPYLTGVCDALANLPVDRLELEKGILRTEAAGRKVGAGDAMPPWRYGAQGYGLVSYEELGLHRLTADDVREWAATWFTRQNAVLWITSDEVPAGLRLNLPDGTLRPVPRPTSALPSTPAYFSERFNGVVFDAVVRRSTPATVFAAVLEREMFRSLRQEGGYSYVADASYHPRGDEFATVTAFADALPDKNDAVLGGFVDVLAKLRVGRIEQADLDSVRTRAEEALRQADHDAIRLPAAAMNALTGQPNPTAEQTLDELRAVSVDDVRAVAAEATATGLLLVPAGLHAKWAGFSPAPTSSTAAVAGLRYQSRQDEEVKLVVGDEGLSLVDGSNAGTVRYADCAVVKAWPDGARELVGLDGISVRVEPTLFPLPAEQLARIEANLPLDKLVRMPARDPGAIPRATPLAPSLPQRPQATARVVFLTVIASIMGVLTLLCAGVLATADPANNPDDEGLHDPSMFLLLGLLLFGTVAFSVWARKIAREREGSR
ncbi:hypothetical protein Ais01nite_75040 [Asanoa ishikariensis]|uniref:Predicted Zn-dependent peptidase n=1 Tax=Asanoa ishikariensis TaxID=137265 RepID=A0A1H3L7K6_9ACTN|nr:insulinase family protein [Asanoa ishikariensis]GIF69469.1 hypothetical protein Ais01nite_75040 [Asanoa ishikariensis]SDY59938.1 Predicted Zn-dependent peptidase [Asanoa ishikariensis]